VAWALLQNHLGSLQHSPDPPTGSEGKRREERSGEEQKMEGKGGSVETQFCYGTE